MVPVSARAARWKGNKIMLLAFISSPGENSVRSLSL